MVHKKTVNVDLSESLIGASPVATTTKNGLNYDPPVLSTPALPQLPKCRTMPAREWQAQSPAERVSEVQSRGIHPQAQSTHSLSTVSSQYRIDISMGATGQAVERLGSRDNKCVQRNAIEQANCCTTRSIASEKSSCGRETVATQNSLGSLVSRDMSLPSMNDGSSNLAASSSDSNLPANDAEANDAESSNNDRNSNSIINNDRNSNSIINNDRNSNSITNNDRNSNSITNIDRNSNSIANNDRNPNMIVSDTDYVSTANDTDSKSIAQNDRDSNSIVNNAKKANQNETKNPTAYSSLGIPTLGLTNRKSTKKHCKQASVQVEAKPQVCIWVKYKIFNILWIDTVAQTFRVHFTLEATWEEPEINGIESGKVKMDEVWKPRRVKFVNELESEFTPAYEVCTWEKNPSNNAVMTCYFNCSASFITRMNLQMFPFDFQDLRITFTMLSRDRNIRFELNPFRESGMDYMNHMLAEWEPLFTHHKFEYQEENSLPIFHIQCKLERRAGYYITNVALPVFLITTLTWLGYAIPVADTGSRMEAILTLVLTSIAFKIVLAGHLPPLSYNTLCDYYVLFSLLFQVAVAVQIGATPMILRALETEDEIKMSESVDRIFGSLLFASYLLMHVVFIVIIKKHKEKQRKAAPPDAMHSKKRKFSL